MLTGSGEGGIVKNTVYKLKSCLLLCMTCLVCSIYIYFFQRTVNVANNWAGRVWGRTGCNFNGNGQGRCATGDCGDKLKCNGAGGVPPVTLAQVTLSGDGGKDFYDISLVDGFNIPVQVRRFLGSTRIAYQDSVVLI